MSTLIYDENVDGLVLRGCPGRTYIYQLSEVLKSLGSEVTRTKRVA